MSRNLSLSRARARSRVHIIHCSLSYPLIFLHNFAANTKAICIRNSLLFAMIQVDSELIPGRQADAGELSENKMLSVCRTVA